MDAPTDSTIDLYVQEMKNHNVSHCVRVCDSSYSPKTVKDSGIEFHDWPFTDGSAPPEEIVSKWFSLIKSTFSNENNKSTIAIHCVAGLGRAPVLVALALIEFAKMEALDAIQFIRSKRRGAINAKQLDYIDSYSPSHSNSKCCTLL